MDSMSIGGAYILAGETKLFAWESAIGRENKEVVCSAGDIISIEGDVAGDVRGGIRG